MASPLLLTNARKGDIIMAWDESEHPRDSDGKFTDGNGTSAKSGSIRVGEGQPAEWESDKVKLPDEQLPRSVGAKWANEKIRIPGKGHARFVEGAIIREKEVFAGKGCRRKIDEIHRLIKDYPGTRSSQWMKVKGITEIEMPDGRIQTAELHWYEEPSVGRVEVKRKRICR